MAKKKKKLITVTGVRGIDAVHDDGRLTLMFETESTEVQVTVARWQIPMIGAELAKFLDSERGATAHAIERMGSIQKKLVEGA